MNQSIQQFTIARTILKYTYGLVPIVAGLDKFTNLLTNWRDYLGSTIINILPFDAGTFMALVGAIEIAAGSLVLWRPRIGAFVVMAWLVAIAMVLISAHHYFDVAIRDLVMAVGAFALAKLSEVQTPTLARS